MDIDPDLLRADAQGLNVYRAAPRSAEEAQRIKSKLEEFFGDR